MKLDGRRESSNVEDRRRMGGGKKASMGIGGMIVVGLLVWMMGGDPLDVIQEVATSQITDTESGSYEPTDEEEQFAVFAKQILAGTEDVWTEIFSQMDEEYIPPKMVLFHSRTTSGCGNATSATGPFYCSADQTVYIDLSFFDEMQNQLQAGGDFAYAYVIAHEVGHHVQYLLGTLDEVNEMQSDLSEVESNRLNVRLELQADFYAGVWAYHDNENYNSLESGDIEEGMNAASQIGDDRLQKEAQGTIVPDSFTHGTSEQRSRWLHKGLTTGNISDGDTFSISYNRL